MDTTKRRGVLSSFTTENLLDEKLLELLHYMMADSLRDNLCDSIDNSLLRVSYEWLDEQQTQ